MEQSRVEARYALMDKDAQQGAYTLNPDRAFCMQLMEGILVNEDRYGIGACPCRLYMGKQEDNLDMVCPCDYRDADLAEYGACFCALYVADKYDDTRQIPDRRPPLEERKKKRLRPAENKLPYPVWRCPVCGYLCAMEHPPAKCPICKAAGERFERFM